jgi:hypothetical protein
MHDTCSKLSALHCGCFQAAKQAELAALDLVRLSKPGGRNAGAGAGEGSGLAWSFLSHLGALLLNKLQMSVRNIHVCFQACAAPRHTAMHADFFVML